MMSMLSRFGISASIIGPPGGVLLADRIPERSLPKVPAFEAEPTEVSASLLPEKLTITITREPALGAWSVSVETRERGQVRVWSEVSKDQLLAATMAAKKIRAWAE